MNKKENYTCKYSHKLQKWDCSGNKLLEDLKNTKDAHIIKKINLIEIYLHNYEFEKCYECKNIKEFVPTIQKVLQDNYTKTNNPHKNVLKFITNLVFQSKTPLKYDLINKEILEKLLDNLDSFWDIIHPTKFYNKDLYFLIKLSEMHNIDTEPLKYYKLSVVSDINIINTTLDKLVGLIDKRYISDIYSNLQSKNIEIQRYFKHMNYGYQTDTLLNVLTQNKIKTEDILYALNNKYIIKEHHIDNILKNTRQDQAQEIIQECINYGYYITPNQLELILKKELELDIPYIHSIEYRKEYFYICFNNNNYPYPDYIKPDYSLDIISYLIKNYCRKGVLDKAVRKVVCPIEAKKLLENSYYYYSLANVYKILNNRIKKLKKNDPNYNPEEDSENLEDSDD